MFEKYLLLKDDSLESLQAIESLDKANIDYEVITFPTDDDLHPPVLFIPEGTCEGIICISSYTNSYQN